MTALEKIVAKTTQKSRRLQRDIAHFVGADKGYFQNARGSRILAYHGVCRSEPTKFNTLFITQKTFEEHLKYYTRYCNMLSLDDFYRQRFSSDKFNLCLTFDDGFANNYTYVLPLLQQYRVPSTFFVTAIGAAGYDILWNDALSITGKYGPPSITFRGKTYHKNQNRHYCDTDGLSLNMELRQHGFAEKAELLRLLDKIYPFRKDKQHTDYLLQMTEAQIRQAAKSPLVTIGAHGYYHNDLAGIPLPDAASELAKSKQYLEQVTGTPVNSLAFPYGSYSPGVVAAAKACGYTQLLATEFNAAADGAEPTMRERLTINPFLSTTNQLHANIRGTY